MNKQTLGWIFFIVAFITSIIPPIGFIFYIVALIFFVKSRKETGGLVGMILTIIFGTLTLLFSLIFLPLIIVGVLGGIPSVGGSGYAVDYAEEAVRTTTDISSQDILASESYWLTSADIGVSPVFSSNDNHVLTFRNNQPNTVEINNIRLYLEDGSTAPIMFEPFTLGIGQEKTISASGSADMSFIDSSLVCPNAGDKYSVGVEIDYTQNLGGVETSFTFDPTQKLLGTCAN